MAQRPYIMMISRLQLDWLRAFSLFIFTTRTLAQADSGSFIWAGAADKEPGFKRLLQLSSSIFEVVLSLTQRRFLRIINGQISVWDILQLIAAYSLVQAIRIWKNRKGTQYEGNDHSNCSVVGGCSDYKSTKSLSRKDSKSMTAGKYRVSSIVVVRMGLKPDFDNLF